jgi:type IV pilus assembly protein PilA
MKFWNKMKKNSKGFTLVEIIVVLVILAVLAAFTIPTMLGFVNEARGKALIAEAREVYVAAQATATEYTANGGTVSDAVLSSTAVGAVDANGKSNATGASATMLNYLSEDLDISTTAKPSDKDSAYWTIVLDTTNNAKVGTVTYQKAGYQVVLTSGDGSEVSKY